MQIGIRSMLSHISREEQPPGGAPDSRRTLTQARIDVTAMDVLSALTGSRVRADVLTVLLAPPCRSWGVSELARAAREPRQLVSRELRRLTGLGIVRVDGARSRRRYEVDTDSPVAKELGRLTQQSRGRIPRIRHALVALRSGILAWLVSRAVEQVPRPGRSASGRALDLIVIATMPRALVRVQLANLVSPETAIHCMSIHEWVARSQKGDVFIRRARRARKLWIVGSSDELARRERLELESKRTLRAALTNWREELSDEWDDEWDPLRTISR